MERSLVTCDVLIILTSDNSSLFMTEQVINKSFGNVNITPVRFDGVRSTVFDKRHTTLSARAAFTSCLIPATARSGSA